MPEDTTDSFEVSEKSAFIFDAKHKGSSNFIVELLDLNRNSKDIIINTVGDFDGTAMSAVSPGKYVFNVNYDKEYELQPIGISENDVIEPPAEIEGEDFDVLPTELTEPIRFRISAQTGSNVIVTLKNGNGENIDLIFNEQGAGDYATTVMQEGMGLFYVETEDDWVVSMETL